MPDFVIMGCGYVGERLARALRGTVATLAMHWGETRVPMQITVEPTAAITLEADERAQFLGEYSVASS